MKSRPTFRQAVPVAHQRGVSLIEVLVAIVLFAFGILGIIGLQAKSIGAVGDANNRSQAALLGEQILGKMWADRANLNAYALNAGDSVCAAGTNLTTNVAVVAWLAELAAALPSVDQFGQQIEIDQNQIVTVTLCWQGPTDPGVRRFTLTTQIS